MPRSGYPFFGIVGPERANYNSIGQSPMKIFPKFKQALQGRHNFEIGY